jgi:formylglycine-generating enzyme required for sulfatase activity
MISKGLFGFFCLCFSLSAFAQKKFKKNPPGTVRINDTLFADKTEVANIHWREYLYYLKQFDSTKVESMLPDTLVWLDTLIINEDPSIQYYFRHPMFNNYPVVGISHEQAIAFCQWRSDRVNEVYSKIPENKRPFKKVTYRLLTKQEWEMLASGDYNIVKYPYGCDSVYKKWRGKYFRAFNYKHEDKSSPDSSGNERAFYTAPVRSFWPNSNKLYNTIGNVAEMVAEKGIAKGGSFFHELDDCKITNDLQYIKPEMWLGFRCVAIIVK